MTLDRTTRTADFIVSRFSRLYPTYWACIALTVATLSILPMPKLASDPQAILANLTMVQTFLGYRAVDGVYWTLFVELCFYACMTLLWQMRLLRQPETILIGWIALKLVWWIFPSAPYILSAVLVLKFVPFFGIGITSYRIWTRTRTLKQQIPVLTFGLVATYLADDVELAVVYAAVMAIIIALSSGKLRQLNHPLLLWLGAISYPLYLVHQNIGYAIITHSQWAGASRVVAVLMAIIVSLILAHIVNRAIEKPSLKAIRSWWKTAREKRPFVLSA